MSYGLTPAEFVQQVYYQQEKVLLDFYPNDDKYREVITELNFVLQELQKEEDWSWLRERIELGTTEPQPGEQIPEYEFPRWVYKPSTKHGDNLHLYPMDRAGRINEWDRIDVSWGSKGQVNLHRQMQRNWSGRVLIPDRRLIAVNLGDTVTFNRPLVGRELHCLAVCDVQRRLEPVHVMDRDGELDEDGLDPDAPKRILEEVPDPNYVVVRTAALHASGSPPAQARVQELTDAAQKLLSAMRQNDNEATEPDVLERCDFGFWNVM